MKAIVIFLLCATATLRAFAAPAEEAPVLKEEVKEEAALNVEEEVPHQGPAVLSAQSCYPGWEYFRGTCYHLNNDEMTWAQAASYCAEFEATLAAVHSRLHYNHLQHMAGSAGHQNIWTGGFHFENSWRWQDGSHFDFELFDAGCSSTALKCIRMYTQTNRGWFSSSCSGRAKSICQIKPNC